jgi:hypothetical protein
MRALDLIGQKFGKLTVLERAENTDQGKTQWLCRCDCGKELVVIGNNLRSGGTESCGCSKQIPHNLVDLTDYVFGRLKVISRDGKRINGKRANGSVFTRSNWFCQCKCGNTVTVCSKELLNGDTKSCGCFQSETTSTRNWKGCGEIPGGYFGSIRLGAVSRGIQFDIIIEQIWDLFVKQEKKCALTGLDLSFKRNSKTASLDRIDSKQGYFIDNLQWVHKAIQRMKNAYSQTEYIKFCKLVAEYHK